MIEKIDRVVDTPNEIALETHRRKVNRTMYLVDPTSFNDVDSPIIKAIKHNDIEDWQKQYLLTFPTEYSAMKFVIKTMQKQYVELSETSYRQSNEQRMINLTLLWKYEPETIKELPAWYHNDVKEVTDGKVLL